MPAIITTRHKYAYRQFCLSDIQKRGFVMIIEKILLDQDFKTKNGLLKVTATALTDSEVTTFDFQVYVERDVSIYRAGRCIEEIATQMARLRNATFWKITAIEEVKE